MGNLIQEEQTVNFLLRLQISAGRQTNATATARLRWTGARKVVASRQVVLAAHESGQWNGDSDKDKVEFEGIS